MKKLFLLVSLTIYALHAGDTNYHLMHISDTFDYDGYSTQEYEPFDGQDDESRAMQHDETEEDDPTALEYEAEEKSDKEVDDDSMEEDFFCSHFPVLEEIEKSPIDLNEIAILLDDTESSLLAMPVLTDNQKVIIKKIYELFFNNPSLDSIKKYGPLPLSLYLNSVICSIEEQIPYILDFFQRIQNNTYNDHTIENLCDNNGLQKIKDIITFYQSHKVPHISDELLIHQLRLHRTIMIDNIKIEWTQYNAPLYKKGYDKGITNGVNVCAKRFPKTFTSVNKYADTDYPLHVMFKHLQIDLPEEKNPLTLIEQYLAPSALLDDIQKDHHTKITDELSPVKIKYIDYMEQHKFAVKQLMHALQQKNITCEELGTAFGYLIGFNRSLYTVLNQITSSHIDSTILATTLHEQDLIVPFHEAHQWQRAFHEESVNLSLQQMEYYFNTFISNFSQDLDITTQKIDQDFRDFANTFTQQ